MSAGMWELKRPMSQTESKDKIGIYYHIGILAHAHTRFSKTYLLVRFFVMLAPIIPHVSCPDCRTKSSAALSDFTVTSTTELFLLDEL